MITPRLACLAPGSACLLDPEVGDEVLVALVGDDTELPIDEGCERKASLK